MDKSRGPGVFGVFSLKVVFRKTAGIILASNARSALVRGTSEKKKRSPVDRFCLEAPAKCPLTMAKRVLGPAKG